ncbi:MAG: hypothetical protein II997_07240 [Clostridia bacterium]|nr:hypothetical protein [Clostridia bacterium]
MKSKLLLGVLALTVVSGSLVGCNMNKDSVIPGASAMPSASATAQATTSTSTDDTKASPDASATTMPSETPGATSSAKAE